MKRVMLDVDWLKIIKKKCSYWILGLFILIYILFLNIIFLLKFKFLCIDGLSYFKIIFMLLKYGYFFFLKIYVLIEFLWKLKYLMGLRIFFF